MFFCAKFPHQQVEHKPNASHHTTFISTVPQLLEPQQYLRCTWGQRRWLAGSDREAEQKRGEVKIVHNSVPLSVVYMEHKSRIFFVASCIPRSTFYIKVKRQPAAGFTKDLRNFNEELKSSDSAAFQAIWRAISRVIWVAASAHESVSFRVWCTRRAPDWLAFIYAPEYLLIPYKDNLS